MRIIDCFWEKDNLGMSTCEITVFPDDSLSETVLSDLEQEYQYVVVKIPVGNVALHLQLTQKGYYFLESQLSVGLRLPVGRGMGKFAEKYMGRIALKKCDTAKEQENIISLIGDDTFETDRIALDPHFGRFTANKRYRNWMQSTINAPGYELYQITIREKMVGFAYFYTKEGKTDYLLAGLFREYKFSGLGILVPLSALVYAKDGGLSKVSTSISSNNFNVVRCYLECGFVIEKINYVFAKVK